MTDVTHPQPSAARPVAIIQDPRAFTPASIPRRVAAFAIDFGGTAGLTTALVLPLISLGFAGYNGTSASEVDGTLVYLAIALIFAVPGVILSIDLRWLRQFGYSIGKRMLGLRILDATTGTPLPRGKLITRMLILFAPLVLGWLLGARFGQPVPLYIAAGIWVLMLLPMLGAGHRGVQDKATNSIVVRIQK